MLSAIQAEVDSLHSIDFGRERLEKCEQLLRKYRDVFHPCHYMLITLRQNLIELYGRVEGYELEDLTDNLLEHKMNMCLAVLNVLNVLYPGKTRTRALLLYDLHAPTVLSAKISYATGTITDAEFKMKLQEAIAFLEESTAILEWEDADSIEYAVSQIGKQSLSQLKASMKAII